MSEADKKKPPCHEKEVLKYGLCLEPLDILASPEKLAKNIIHLLTSIGLK